MNKTLLASLLLLPVTALAYSPNPAAWNSQLEGKTVVPSSNTPHVKKQALKVVLRTDMSSFAGPYKRMSDDEYLLSDKSLLPVPERILSKIQANEELVGVGTANADLLAEVTHNIDDAGLQARGITTLLSAGVSDYWGSSPERVQNIHKALFRYDGLIIPAGHTFSFNKHLDAITLENGYAMSKIIYDGESIDGIGGGVCQASTTLYRAGLFAGLPINERYAHSFALSRYSPYGLDSAIYPGSKDLRFTNTTSGEIMIRVFDRDQRIFVLLYGTKDRETNVEPVYQEGSTAHGMRTAWKRSVTQNNATTDIHIKSRYIPLAQAN